MEQETVLTEGQELTEVVLDEAFEAEYGDRSKNHRMDPEDFLYESSRDRQAVKEQMGK